MTKNCPLKNYSEHGEMFCDEGDCAWWVSDWAYPKDRDPVDAGSCAILEIAEQLRSLEVTTHKGEQF